MEIYNHDGTLLLSVNVDDTSVRYRAIKGEDTLTLKYSLPEHVEVPLGAYCTFKEDVYYLMLPENLTMRHRRSFEYTLVLDAASAAAKRYKFINPVDGRLKFSLTATPREHLQMFVDNMNRRDGGWLVGDCIEHTEIVLSYNHTSCHDALVQLADELEVDYWFDGKTVNLGKLELYKDNPLPLSYGGDGEGLKPNVQRTNYSDALPVEVLYVQGTSQNIDRSKYGAGELHLPESATIRYDGAHFEGEAGFDDTRSRQYVTDAQGFSVRRGDKGLSTHSEDSLDCTEIIPTREETVAGVEGVSDEKHFYDIHFESDVDYKKYVIAGEHATVIFQTGMLAGKEFDLATDGKGNLICKEDEQTGTWKVELNPQEIDGITMPDKESGYMPVAGDKFKVFNIQLPDEYICNNETKGGAEWDMLRYAVRHMYDNEDVQYTVSGELDELYAKRNWENIGGRIRLGSYISFTDRSFQPDPLLIRIVGIKEYVNKPYSPAIEISNAAARGTLVGTLNRIENGEAYTESLYERSVQLTRRRYNDSVATMEALKDAVLGNFTDAINPLSVQTMAMLVGDAALQFRFVNGRVNPVQVSHVVTYDQEKKVLHVPAGIIQHMTLGVTAISTSQHGGDLFWDVPMFESPSLGEALASKKYYLYAKCGKTAGTGEFLLSETGIGLEEEEGYWHLLLGILCAELEGERSYASLYGFTEILPGQITTDMIRSADGSTYFDLANNVIKGTINFSPDSTGLEDTAAWKGLTEQIGDLQDQVDGAIETWYAAGVPTLGNYPASDWADETTRANHVGDLYYDGDTGKAYRFMRDEGGAYLWTPIADEDVAKALKDAQEALQKANAAIKGVDIEYALGDSNTTPPTTGWSTTAPQRTDGKYLWQRTVTYTSSGDPVYSTPVWISGIDGDDGNSPYIGDNGNWFIGGEDTGYKAEGVNGSTPEIGANGNWWLNGTDTGHQAVAKDGVGIEDVEEWYAVSATQDGSAVGSWYDNAVPTAYGEDFPYLWNKERIIYTDGTSAETVAAIIGVWGKDGKPGRGIVKIENVYQLGTSPTEAPTGVWSADPQTPTDEYPYLWNKELITYTDSETPEETAPAVIGVKGDNGATPEIRDGWWYVGDEKLGKAEGNDGLSPHIGDNGNWWLGDEDLGKPATGNGVKEVKEWYCATATQDAPDDDLTKWTLGQTPADFGQAKPYLWNYEEITGTDGKVMSSVKSLVGVWGKDGKEIAKVEEYYAISASKDAAPALGEFSTSFSAPTLDEPYLWNYEKIYYTEGDPDVTTPAIIGIMGATIVSITELYYLSSTPTAPDAPEEEVTETGKVIDRWTQTCPDFVSGHSYFTCSQILRSDGVMLWSEVVPADNVKNHVFYTKEGEHPLPPYNVGDLWVCAHYVDTTADAGIVQVEDSASVVDEDADGNPVTVSDANTVEYTNEILVCVYAKASGEEFSVNDWQPAGDYCKESDYQYLREALPETSTVINGGLVLGTFLGVTDATSGSASDGNVVAGMCGVRGDGDEFYDADRQSKLLVFAGVDPDGDSSTKYKQAKTQIWDDGTFKSTEGELEGLTIKSTRSPFVDFGPAFSGGQSITKYDCGFVDGTVVLPWGVECSGRRVVLAGEYFHIDAGDGKVFYIDGVEDSRATFTNALVELIGLGTEDEFRGWAVLSCTTYGRKYKGGAPMNTLAAGLLKGSSSGVVFGEFWAANYDPYDFGGTRNGCIASRAGRGVYKLTMPGWWFEKKDDIFVNLTGYGAIDGGTNPIKATLYSISGSTSEGWTLEIRTSDDETENDGAFFIEIKTLGNWTYPTTRA